MSKKVTPTEPTMERLHPTSRANRIAALEIGECYTESKVLSLDEENTASLNEAETALRNTLSKERTRAMARTDGHNYTVHTGWFFTASKDVVVNCVVCRVE